MMTKGWTRVGRRCPRAYVIAATLTIILASLLTPAAGEAASWRWKNDADGFWNVPANWVRVSGDPGDGYPNRPGDEANFPSTLTAARTITIPIDVTVTVGAIAVFGNQEVTIAGMTGARLTLESPTGLALVRDFGSAGALNVNVPVTLHTPLTFLTALNTTIRVFAIDELLSGDPRAVTKTGSGTLLYRSANGYTGKTKVEDGALVLEGTSAPNVRGLEIGDGNGAAESAVVYSVANDQLAPSVIEVNKDGALKLSATTRIGDLVVRDGLVHVGSQHVLTMGGLVMTGGLLRADEGARLVLGGNVTAVSSEVGRAKIAGDAAAALDLNMPGGLRTFAVTPGPNEVDLEIAIKVVGGGMAGLLKENSGTLRFTGAESNTYGGATRVQQGRLELAREQNKVAVPGRLDIGPDVGTAVVAIMPALDRHNIAQTSTVTVGVGGLLLVESTNQIESLQVDPGGRVSIVDDGAQRKGYLRTTTLTMRGGRIATDKGRLVVDRSIVATSNEDTAAVIDGTGSIKFLLDIDIAVANGPQPIDLRIDVDVFGNDQKILTKRGPGAARFGGKSHYDGGTIIVEGTLFVMGEFKTTPITGNGGALGGNGTTGIVKISGGGSELAPGLSPGRLTTGDVSLAAGTALAMELNGSTAGTGYDQLDVRGTVSLGGATLALTTGFTPPESASFTLILNDGIDPIVGTFAKLAEGAKITLGTHTFTLTYQGGDGNDVVLSDPTAPLTWFLAEGATGEFFDDDVLMANPNDTDAPVTLTFLQEGGQTVVERRTIPAQSRMTVHVDQIAGLESTSASVKVASDDRLPLVVERSMFWDAGYYGGHTANAVSQPETRWTFAEGFQGYFDTYILIANANGEETTATLTFLRENDTPIVKTEVIGPFARKTVYAGDYDELIGRAFGVIVEATRPVIAERAMYFGSIPGYFWAGGHVNTGIVAPSTSWFHAEGATGTYFNTFVLLSNPQETEAHVELKFLLDTGEVITRSKTIGPRQRVTVNPAEEDDARLENASVSTIVTSDVAIVSERSMYWPGESTPFGEGHNSSGVVSTATRWGLAEGRIGGPRGFITYILLANPSAQEAQVTITYLREAGTPIVKTYTVPATSRFNVDVKSVVPELEESSFGARIEVTNGVPIAVERSLYWNANGVNWAGGTNALATPLP